MIDVSVIQSGGATYAVKSSLKEAEGGAFAFRVLYVYEVERVAGSYQKRRTLFDAADGGKFNQLAYGQLFRDIAESVGRKYRIATLVV